MSIDHSSYNPYDYGSELFDGTAPAKDSDSNSSPIGTPFLGI